MYNIDMKTETLYQLHVAADLLKVHPRTIKRWHESGYVRLVELPGGHFRIPGRELARLLEPLPFDELPEPEV